MKLNQNLKDKKGKLIIISGPSGVGKGTLCKNLIKNKNLNLKISVSHTTRKIRNGEQEGVNYFYISKNEFKHHIKKNNFLEHAKFIDDYYGTLKDNCEKKISKGKNVILEIETKGALQIMEKFPDAITFFILPPDLEELKNRILKRNSDEINVIEKRLEKATLELNLKSKYKYNIINDDFKKTLKQIEQILIKELNINE